MVAIIVIPSYASFLSILQILKAVELSRPLVGSSKSIKLGFVINSYPMQVLFLSPPEILFRLNPPIFWFLQLASYNLFIISSAFTSISSSLKLVLSFAAKQKLSMGVMVSINISSCITKAPSFPKSCFPTIFPLH